MNIRRIVLEIYRQDLVQMDRKIRPSIIEGSTNVLIILWAKYITIDMDVILEQYLRIHPSYL